MINTSSIQKPLDGSFKASDKRLDLNLLTVFDMVMTERHVSRAAERLEMTQSAVSNAINRLRLRFEDRLFVKVAKGVDPTPKALELWPRIHEAMQTLRHTIEPQSFDASLDAMQFRIAMVDITVSLLAPHLHGSIAPLSPKTNLFFVPYDSMQTGSSLMRGDLDFSIGINPPRSSVLQTMQLWSDTFTIAARRDHPLMQDDVSLEDFCTTPQIAINEPGDLKALTMVDVALEDQGLKRNIVMTVNQFVVIPAILQMSDMITVVPSRFASSPSISGMISTRPLPLKIPDATIYLSWHHRNNKSGPHQWMKERIMQAVDAVNRQHEWLQNPPDATPW